MAALQPTKKRSKSVAYVATIAIYISEPRPGLRKQAERIYGKRIRIDSVPYGGVRVVAHLPSQRLLAHFASLQDEQDGVTVSWLDIAMDTITRSVAEAEQLQERDERCLHFRESEYERPIRHKNSSYWNAQRQGRNLSAYSDKPARTVPGGPPCYHLELRYRSTKAVNRAMRTDKVQVQDLIGADIDALASRLLAQETYEEAVCYEEVVRRTVAKDRRCHLAMLKAQQPLLTDRFPFLDRNRASLRYRVVETLRRGGYVDSGTRTI